MDHFINIKHTHLVALILTTWKNNNIEESLKAVFVTNQHIAKVEQPPLGVNNAEVLLLDIL